MTSKPTTIAAFPPVRPGWRMAVESFRSGDRSRRHLISGSLIMLIGYGVVSLVNFGYNVVVARLLGPAAFGHAAAMVTMLMLFSAITLAYQLVCAKFVAKNEDPLSRSAVYRWLMRRAWAVGAGLGLVIILSSDMVHTYLRVPSPWLLVMLGLGAAFYVPLGVRRGGMQGTCAFGRLAANFMIEALVRFLGALVLIELGFGVMGAVAAITASVILAYFLPLTQPELKAPAVSSIPASFREGMQAIVFFIGQVIINNIDILLVKHFFAPEQAGVYAAIALVGRILYFASWSVVSAMFPISAGAKPKEEDPSVLVVPLMLVLSMAVVFIVGLAYFPDFILQAIFGALFQQTGHSATHLMGLYAAATGTYALSVVLMAYEMSRRVANTGWLQLVFAVFVALGITIFHRTLRQVVIVQLVLMVFLLVAVSLPFFRSRENPLQEAA
jgi:O-antigen/teichoic acid export membrane protein